MPLAGVIQNELDATPACHHGSTDSDVVRTLVTPAADDAQYHYSYAKTDTTGVSSSTCVPSCDRSSNRAR